MVKETCRDYWKDWILGREEDRPLHRPWTKVTNREIDRLAKWGYVRYHSNPFYLLKATLSVKSFKEFKRKLFAYLDMLFRQESISKKGERFSAYNENSFCTFGEGKFRD